MSSTPPASSSNALRVADRICDVFESEWKAGSRPDLAKFINELPESERSQGLEDLLAVDVAYRSNRGESPSAIEYTAIFAEFESVIVRVFKEEESRQRKRSRPGSCRVQAESEISFSRPVIPGLQVLRKAGADGMGIVYEAFQQSLNRSVAVKVLRGGRDADPEAVKRFRREAEAAARLDHPTEQVEAALAALPEVFRVVATLYFLQDFSYQEIAEMIGVPVGTVRSPLHRGRRMLQKALWTLAQERGIVALPIEVGGGEG